MAVTCRRILLLLTYISIFFITVPFNSYGDGPDSSANSTKDYLQADNQLSADDEWTDEDELDDINDPFESFNRAVFTFNDRFYFSVLKPVAKGYSRILPEEARVCVRKFFSNLTTPVRLVNSVLQFKFREAGIEFSRFVINSTIGFAGFKDPARGKWKLYKHDEDLGQTLGFYKFGPGFYLNLPFIGPSSLRDSIGLTGDLFLDPTLYMFSNNRAATAGIYIYDKGVNATSLEIGSYEDMKKNSLDPYIFIRDAYHQHRESKVKE